MPIRTLKVLLAGVLAAACTATPIEIPRADGGTGTPPPAGGDDGKARPDSGSVRDSASSPPADRSVSLDAPVQGAPDAELEPPPPAPPTPDGAGGEGTTDADGSPGDGSPGDGSPGDGSPGDGSSVDGSPVDGFPGDGFPGDASPGDSAAANDLTSSADDA